MYAIYGNMDPINIPPMLAYIHGSYGYETMPSADALCLVAMDCDSMPGTTRLLAIILNQTEGSVQSNRIRNISWSDEQKKWKYIYIYICIYIYMYIWFK